MATRYQRIPDSGHPTTEKFAEDLYTLLPLAMWPEGFDGRTGTWEREPVELREAFRGLARRFMAGDLSLLPPAKPIHQAWHDRLWPPGPPMFYRKR